MDGTPGSEFSYQPEEHKSRTKFWVEVIVVALLLMAGGFYFYSNFDQLTGRGSTPNPTGFLLMSLAPAGDNAVNMYMLDVKSGEVAPVFQEGFVIYTPHVSDDESRLVYASAPVDRDSPFEFPYSRFLQLFSYDLQTGEWQEITTSTTTLKGVPRWSPAGSHVAFHARESAEGDRAIPDEWNIYITDGRVEERLIGEGMYPQWSPGGEAILSMVSSGLRLHDLEVGESQDVWSFFGTDVAYADMTLTLSNDKALIAWANPYGDVTAIGEISEWDPFVIAFSQTIPNITHWPVFSPNDRYLAGINAANENINGERSVEVVIYDLETGKTVSIFGLEDFNPETVFLTDWVEKAL